MKWLGQYIQSLTSRFRSDVYLESISSGTIASGAHLGLDSNNKIVKAVDGGGDLTSIVAGTGLSGTSLTGPIPTLNVDASLAHVTTLAGLTTIGATGINTLVSSDDVQFYNPVNGGNPSYSFGASTAERIMLQPVYAGTSQILDYVQFKTFSASTSANHGAIKFLIDSSPRLTIDDGGIDFVTGNGISINGTDILTDSSGTATLSNIDALDATTIATFETAMEANLDTLSSLTTVGTIGTGVWQGTPITGEYIGDDQVSEDKLANTLLAEIDANTAKATNVATDLGISGTTDARTIVSSDGDNVIIPVATTDVSGVMSTELFDAVATNTDKVTNVTTNLTGTTSVDAFRVNSSDGTNVSIAEASGSIAGVMSVAHHDKLDGIETSATADQSKSDIDGLAITTVGTLDTGVWNATKILSPKTTHVLHYPFRGFCQGISSGNFQYSEDFSDPQFPFQLNTDYGDTVIANGDTTSHQIPFRSSGMVAPRACTAIDMVGWASCAAGEVTISLCKLTLSRNSTAAIVPIVVATTTFTSLGNNKMEDFAVSDAGGGDGAVTIVTSAIAKGDILMPFVLSPNAKTTFFNLTLEVEA